MTVPLLLDEHYSQAIAAALSAQGHDVLAVVSSSDLRGSSDPELFRWAAANGRRLVTENVKDFRPLLMEALAAGTAFAPLLLVPPRRFPRGRGDRTAVIVAAIHAWLVRPDAKRRPAEDWLVE